MIRFVQDYTTKAIPPESFKKDQQVERSAESEAYFVRMGVAGYLVDGKLVDQDYQPMVPTTLLVEVVAPGDRRFAGRAGETIGLAAPARASTGPGNAALLGGTVVSAAGVAATATADGALDETEADQLRADLATVVGQLADHQQSTAKQLDALTADLNSAQGARETALADLATARSDADTARGEVDGLKQERDAARSDADAAKARVTDLEAQLAAATAPPAKTK